MSYKNRGSMAVSSLVCHALFMGIGVLLALGLVCIEPAWGQSTVGTILGTITDQSGAAVPSSAVTVTNTDTTVSRKVQTDSAGNYQFPDLQPGNYRVVAESAGFETGVVSGIVLLVNQTARYDVRLVVGTVTQQIEVSASGVAKLQTDDATLGQVVGQRQIEDLPLNGRNFLQLISLGAGAAPVVNSPAEAIVGDTGRTGFAYTVSGQEVTSMSYLIDGVEVKMNFDMMAAFLPSLDAIQEFKIQRSAFSAEFGGAPVVINIATKSGTNRLHGSAFEYVRNNIFDASQIQDPIVNGSRQIAPFRQNQFGGSIGGPVVLPHVYNGRNRTFWFFDYEGLREHRFSEFIGWDPTSAMLGGDFSGLNANGVPIPIYDPATYNPATGLRQQFSGNIIPKGRIDAIGQKLTTFFNAPTIQSENIDQFNSFSGRNRIDTTDQYHVRIDHTISDRTSIFGRFSTFNYPLILPLGVDSVSTSNVPLKDKNAVFAVTHMFSPTAVNELRLGFDKEIFDYGPYNPSGKDIGAEIGFVNVNPKPSQYGAPQVSGVSGWGYGPPSWDIDSSGQLFQYHDTQTLIRGKHTIKFGGEIRDQRPWILAEDTGKRPSFTFTGDYTAQLQNGVSVAGTGYDLADMLLGFPELSVGQIGTTYTKFSATKYHIFLLDDVKVRRGLTFSLGFRYEYNEYYKAYDNDIEGFCTTCSQYGEPGMLVQTKLGQVRPRVTDPDWREFGPRVGFAWQPFGATNTVFRGAYGIFYDNTKGDEINGVEFPTDKTAEAHFENQNPTPTFTLEQAFPLVPPGVNSSPYVTELRDRWPQVFQWNLNLQHKFATNWMFEIGYVGSHARNLSFRYGINQAHLDANPLDPTPIQSRRPFPLYGDVLDFSHPSFAIMNYDGLQTRLEKTFSHGFTLLAGFTYSRCLNLYNSDSSDDNNMNAYNPQQDYGLCGFQIKSRFNVSGVWEIPSRLHGFAGALTKGWQLNSILQDQSGTPLAGPYMPGDWANVGSWYHDRLIRTCDGNWSGSQRSVAEWFNTSCFLPPEAGTFGNAGRAIITDPGVNTLDASLFRNFRLGEAAGLQFRWEVFNALNNNNFDPPGNTYGTAGYGKITTEEDKREMQFSLRLTF